jgi:hypothetical protein
MAMSRREYSPLTSFLRLATDMDVLVRALIVQIFFNTFAADHQEVLESPQLRSGQITGFGNFISRGLSPRPEPSG